MPIFLHKYEQALKVGRLIIQPCFGFFRSEKHFLTKQMA